MTNKEKRKSIVGSFINTTDKNENDEKMKTTIYISKKVFRNAKIKIAENGETMSGIIEEFLEKYIKK